ncbi:energy-coupling factor transporter ATP-binding protein EcfA2 [Dietzia sp. 2505]|uniref:TIR domain-containing protein n=1 Tax=Dietzia sp. 2505 TaxID=3156457 RepID=UPI0033918446
MVIPEHRLAEVFNEAGLPEVTYVAPREAKQIVGSLATAGKHVTLVGPSGSGKSTVAYRSLVKLGLGASKVHSFSGRTYNQIESILEVLSLEFGVEPEIGQVEEWLRVFDLVFIDDVHHLHLKARMELASQLKLWHEKGIRFFMVGIAKTSDEILGQDPELAIRNDVWRLGTQSDDFMLQLVGLGESALNITIDDEGKATAIRAAQGSPSIFQAICRIACVDAEVLATQAEAKEVKIELPLIRESVVHQYDGRYLAKTVNLARGRRQARSVHDTYFRIVEQIAANGKEQTSKDELYHKVVGSKDASKKTQIRNSFYRAMNNLPKVIEEHGLSDVLIYENDTLTIDDPVFRFYLDHLDFAKVRAQVNIRRVGYEYDVAVSFAGENREIVVELVNELTSRGLEVFYDFDQKGILWGKDLRAELQKIYSQDAQFMVICLSDYYPEKDWTVFEFEVGKTASKKRTGEYLLPVVIGDESPSIVGLPATVGHLALNSESVSEVADLVQDKLSRLPLPE